MGQKVVVAISTTILFLTGILLGYVLSQLVLGHLALTLVTFLGTFSLIVIFATLYYVLFWEFRRQQAQPAGRPSLNQEQYSADEFAPPINQLKNQLTSLLGGDIEGAERLVAQARKTYPNMPEHWYWQRVITDIERDKR
ncbi:MAG: ABC transporter permease [Calothrix sp. C42_A2020_038]|nr:ABC transporter permease [Calothrix sp. C42_A2020_038]